MIPNEQSGVVPVTQKRLMIAVKAAMKTMGLSPFNNTEARMPEREMSTPIPKTSRA